jgi:endonuclease G
VIISEELIAKSEKHLDFDPQQLSRHLSDSSPIANETPDRLKTRLIVAKSQGLDVLERILDGNDLMPINYFDRGMAAARAVGRIHKRHPQSGALLDYATGFLISPRLLLTNNHVFSSIEDTQRSEVEFNYQRDGNDALLGSEFYAIRSDQFFFTNVDLDFTVVAVEATARSSQKPLSEFGWLFLDPQIGKVSPGEFLTIIQHPEGLDKQIALRENQLLKIAEETVWYRTDTSPGSSGAPVFNDSWQVIALHHSGVPATDDQGNYLTVDGRIWTGTARDSQIKWIANEGIRVSRIVASVQAAYRDHPLIVGIFDPPSKPVPNPHVILQTQPNIGIPIMANSTSRDRKLTYAPEREEADDPAISNPTGVQFNLIADGQAIRVNIPLTITVQLGGDKQLAEKQVAIAPTQPSQEGNSDKLAEQERFPVSSYRDRQGYDPNFLGNGNKRVPLPQMTTAMQADCAVNTQAKPGQDKYVLPYHHFSIVMNKVRKIAFYTAVNIDGSLSRRLSRGKDKWILDSRIDADAQTDNSLYAKNDLDRGHLVRRLDPVWGEGDAILEAANMDTFHFTNCSPQHKDFNQSDVTWQGLENYILDNTDAENLHVSVFTGPVFRDDDEDYRGIQLPREFWKVLVIVRDGRLSATAYLLSQADLIRDLSDEAFSNDRAVRTYQVPVRTIEKLTGLSFNLSTFDPLAAAPTGKESAPVLIPISSYQQMHL